MKHKIKNRTIGIRPTALGLLLGAMLLLASCVEDLTLGTWDPVVEGEDATISLSVELPTMAVVSRVAGIDPNSDDASRVSDLWVGIYNASTGKRTGEYKKYYNEVFQNEHTNNGHHNITINAKSGMSYIVAVANASQNRGVAMDGEASDDLVTLLDEADTWEKFKNLAVLLNSPQSIQYSGPGMLMSGIYYDSHDEPGPKYQESITNDDPAPVGIEPGKNNLPGCVQLRRVAAYVKFNIQVASQYRDFITFTPVSWQVCNLPGLSYVHERSGSNNAADHEVLGLPQSFNSLTYHDTPVYDGAQLFPTAPDGTSSFDFYMMENKHTALASANVTQYTDREREYKTNDEKNTGWYEALVAAPGTEIPAKPSYDPSLSNNNATFVVVRARLIYYYLADDDECTPVAPPSDSSDSRYVRRVGDAVYSIHLGYCESKSNSQPTAATCQDFNSRRNTQYTYNVTVYGVDKIRVEAVSKTESETGAEGIVTDVIGNAIELDSHYAVFNIQLSDQDRMGLSWRVQSPFGDNTIDMMYSTNDAFAAPGLINLRDDEEKLEALPINQFYNWIQFRPTTDENVLAHYPGDPRLLGRTIQNDDPKSPGTIYQTQEIAPVAKTSSDAGIWYLQQMRDVANLPHPDVKAEDYKDYLKRKASGGVTVSDAEDEQYKNEFTKKRWYTVFVDEYVYEYRYNDQLPSLTGENDDPGYVDDTMEISQWGNFVNRDSRKVWIALSNFAVSPDAESLYAHAAYLISQESIQTYYTDQAKQAIGIECTNESYKKDFGINKDPNSASRLNDNLPYYHGGVYHEFDGLLNLYWYVTDQTTSNRWCHAIADEKGVFVSNNEQLDSEDYKNRNNRPRIGTLRVGTDDTSNTNHVYYIPDHKETFMSACLARNRDLNNDGVIGANEMRWYLPTDATYTRIILGSVSLRSPMFNMNDFQMSDIKAGEGTEYSHYAGSNGRMVWAEELAATGPVYLYGPAANIRCIRNLGQEMNLVPDMQPDQPGQTAGKDYAAIDQAYHHDEATHTVTLDFYDMTALREPTQPGGFLTAHVIGDIASYASRKFKYANKDCNHSVPGLTYANTNGGIENTNDQIYTSNDNGGEMRTFTGWWNFLANNSICGTYTEETNGSDKGTWRTPNISELAIMRLLNIVLKDRSYMSCSYEYFVNRNNRGNYNDNQHWFMGLNGIGDITAQPHSSPPVYVRCVKDVE